MKRTLITLLALAGVAMGGSVTYTSDDFTNGAITLDANFFKSGETAKYDYILDLKVDAIVSTLVNPTPALVHNSAVTLSSFVSGGTTQRIGIGNYGTYGVCLQTTNGNNFGSTVIAASGNSFSAVSDATNELTKYNNVWYILSNKDWWEEESIKILSNEELNKFNNISIILSHSLPFQILPLYLYKMFKEEDDCYNFKTSFDENLNIQENYLRKIFKIISPKTWISGHYHKSFNQFFYKTKLVSISIMEFYNLNY